MALLKVLVGPARNLRQQPADRSESLRKELEELRMLLMQFPKVCQPLFKSDPTIKRSLAELQDQLTAVQDFLSQD